jgi:hypothetical protein
MPNPSMTRKRSCHGGEDSLVVTSVATLLKSTPLSKLLEKGGVTRQPELLRVKGVDDTGTLG